RFVSIKHVPCCWNFSHRLLTELQVRVNDALSYPIALTEGVMQGEAAGKAVERPSDKDSCTKRLERPRRPHRKGNPSNGYPSSGQRGERTFQLFRTGRSRT
ncbi:unnamed protein product, partial [Nesidiocoris tenuis]